MAMGVPLVRHHLGLNNVLVYSDMEECQYLSFKDSNAMKLLMKSKPFYQCLIDKALRYCTVGCSY